MTKISSGSAVVRETAVEYRGKPLVVTLRPGFLTLHQKGCQDRVDLDYASAFELALKAKAIQERNSR